MNVDGCARDVAGVVARQEGDQGGDVFRFGDSAEDRVFDNLLC
jgi:hypothetical protein